MFGTGERCTLITDINGVMFARVPDIYMTLLE